MLKSKDHSKGVWEKTYPYAFLWRRVKDDPAVFYPKALPYDYPVNSNTGDWVVDPQDGASFFVPQRECGGVSSRGWRAEALKAINRFNKEEQLAHNNTKRFVWPLYAAVVWLSKGSFKDDDEEMNFSHDSQRKKHN